MRTVETVETHHRPPNELAFPSQYLVASGVRQGKTTRRGASKWQLLPSQCSGATKTRRLLRPPAHAGQSSQNASYVHLDAILSTSVPSPTFAVAVGREEDLLSCQSEVPSEGAVESRTLCRLRTTPILRNAIGVTGGAK